MMKKVARKVLLVMVEGLDSIAFRKAVAANFEMLRQAGASTLEAHAPSVISSTTNLASILASSAAFKAPNNRFPLAELRSNIINLAHQQGLSISVFHNNSALNRLLDQSATKDFCYLNARLDEYDFKIMHMAAECIRIDRPDLCFVYLGWDEHAKTMCHESTIDDCERMAETSDRAMGIILNMMSLFGLFKQYHIHLLGIPSRTLHLARKPNRKAIRVPWILLGPSIKQNYSIANEISLLDSAPTISKLLFLPQLPAWEGHPIEEAFAECERQLKSVA